MEKEVQGFTWNRVTLVQPPQRASSGEGWSGTDLATQEQMVRSGGTYTGESSVTKCVNISFPFDPTICPWVSEDASSIT